MFPRSPRLVSFPCFSTAPSRFLSSFPRKLRGNAQFTGSEAGLRERFSIPNNSNTHTHVIWGLEPCSRARETFVWFGPNLSQLFGKIPGILRVYLENPRYVCNCREDSVWGGREWETFRRSKCGGLDASSWSCGTTWVGTTLCAVCCVHFCVRGGRVSRKADERRGTAASTSTTRRSVWHEEKNFPAR